MSTTDMSIFDTFIAAKQALDELPAVKAELAKVNNDLALEQDMITIADEEAIKAKEEIAKLKSALSAKEAELASATFRAKQSADMLDNLRGLLGVQSTPVGDHTSPVAGEAGSKIDGSKSEPMPEEERYWHSKIKAMPNEVEVPQDSASMLLKPEHLPGPLPGPDSPATTYGVVDEGEFVSHDPEPEVARYPEALPKPYADRPHWQKPSAMSWEEWTEKGGDTPYWWPKEAGQAAF
jgi:hypothetical protein